jgi:pSer/pThr/pTyr-binding forkhead associated (FHA) protein
MPTLRVFDRGGEAKDHLLGDLTLVGRQVAVDVLVPDRRVALRHAVIERRGTAYVLKDLGSAHGTVIGGVNVQEHVLRDGDPIVFGRTRCEFSAAPQASAEEHARVAPRVSLTVQDSDAVPQALELREGIIGAFSHAVLRIRGGSLRHARVVLFAGNYHIEALDGQVVLDGLPVARAPLTDGATLEMGMLRATLRFADPPPPLLRVYTGPDPHTSWSCTLGVSTRIGALGHNDVVIAADGVSREHCRIVRQGDDYIVEDLKSANGVLIGSERVERRTLRHGDRLRLGEAVCVFLINTEAVTPAIRALRRAFFAVSLPTPPVPEPFVPLLQAFTAAWFGTRRTDGLLNYGSRLFDEYGDPEPPDYLITGYTSHQDTLMVHYFLHLGPLLVILEIKAGHEGARAEVAEAFAGITALIAAVPSLRARGVPAAGLRVLASSLDESRWEVGAAHGLAGWRAALHSARAWAESDEPYTAGAGTRFTSQSQNMATLQIGERSRPAGVVAPDALRRHSVALGEEAVIGRAPTSEIHLTDPWVSRRHCRIFLLRGAYYIEDLGSKLGTMVDERLILGAYPLADGSKISVGHSSMSFCANPPSLVFG